MERVPGWWGDTMACPSCGSWAVKADRGLAGRMICARCGHPLGLGTAPGLIRGRARRRWGVALPRHWRGWLGLAGLVGLSAALAAQAPTPDGRESPPMSPTPSPSMGVPVQPGGLGM